jgi:hypothetical protein
MLWKWKLQGLKTHYGFCIVAYSTTVDAGQGKTAKYCHIALEILAFAQKTPQQVASSEYRYSHLVSTVDRNTVLTSIELVVSCCLKD